MPSVSITTPWITLNPGWFRPGSAWSSLSGSYVGQMRSYDFDRVGMGFPFDLATTIVIGSTVNTALLTLYPTSTGTLSFKIKAELAGSPGAMANLADYISRRGLTTVPSVVDTGLVTVALVTKTSKTWTSGTPIAYDVVALIQELVTAFAVTKVFIFVDNHDDVGAIDRFASVNTFTGQAKLDIDWTPPVVPTVASVTPNTGRQEDVIPNVALVGTNFIGATAVSFGAGISVTGFSVVDDSHILADLDISAGASPGVRTVSVTSPGGTGSLVGGFTVLTACPSVTSVAASAITTDAATLNGAVTVINDTVITEEGWVYGNISRGDPGDVAPAASGYGAWVTIPGSFGIGGFSGGVGSLTPATTYYFRAVAKNDKGSGHYAYGAELQVHTLYPGSVAPVTVASPTLGGDDHWRGSRHSCYCPSNKTWYSWMIDGTRLVAYKSTDKTTWVSAGNIDDGTGWGLVYFDGFFDGTFLHFTYSTDDVAGSPLFYRRAAPQPGGGLALSAEQTVYYDLWCLCANLQIAVDSGGYPWIAALHVDTTGGIQPFPRLPRIWKSSAKNGTWANAAGFPYDPGIITTLGGNSHVFLVPLTSGKMFAIYEDQHGQEWNGATWEAEEHLATSFAGSWASAVGIGDNVELAYRSGVTVCHRTRTYGVGWGAETTLLGAGAGVDTHPFLAKGLYGSLAVFWLSIPLTDHLYAIKRLKGVWGSVIDWLTDPVLIPYALAASYSPDKDGNALVVWPLTPSNDFRFAYFLICPPVLELPKSCILRVPRVQSIRT